MDEGKKRPYIPEEEGADAPHGGETDHPQQLTVCLDDVGERAAPPAATATSYWKNIRSARKGPGGIGKSGLGLPPPGCSRCGLGRRLLDIDVVPMTSEVALSLLCLLPVPLPLLLLGEVLLRLEEGDPSRDEDEYPPPELEVPVGLSQ